MGWRCSISSGADPAVLPGLCPGDLGSQIPLHPGTPHPKGSMRITPTLTVGKTPELTQFNQIKHSVPTGSPAAEKGAVTFPESHPAGFPFQGRIPLSLPQGRHRAAPAPSAARLSLPNPPCPGNQHRGNKSKAGKSWEKVQHELRQKFLRRWPKLGFLGLLSLGSFSSPISWNSSGQSFG